MTTRDEGHKDENWLPFLLECFDYDPETGVIKWKNSRPRRHFPSDHGYKVWHKRDAGNVITSTSSGYIQLQLMWKGKKTREKGHRFAWAVVHGSFPEDPLQIDHKNRDRSDNRIKNLRLVTNAENGRNRKIAKNNKSGVNGVSYIQRDDRWEARIDGVFQRQKRFKTKEEAVKQREQWDKELGFSVERREPDGPPAA